MNIILKKGILGFEHLKKYELLDMENSLSFKEFNSIEEDCVGFIVVSPFEVVDKYEMILDQEAIDKLEVESSTDIIVFNIITIGKTLEESTVNMKAPIVINIKNNYGMQIVMQDDKYHIKHPLLRGDNGC